MEEPRWLDEDEQQTWRRLAAAITLLPAALEAQLQRDARLTHVGYWVLAMLSEAPGRSLRMSDLAALSNSSLSRLSHTVARLERQGWVRRHPCPDDKRANVAVLTDDGYDKIVATAPGHVETVRSLVFDALTDGQIRDLDAICRALLKRLDPGNRLPLSSSI